MRPVGPIGAQRRRRRCLAREGRRLIQRRPARFRERDQDGRRDGCQACPVRIGSGFIHGARRARLAFENKRIMSAARDKGDYHVLVDRI